MQQNISITASYIFFPIEESGLKALQIELIDFGKAKKMRGLVLIATEGLNATVSGSSSSIAEWKTFLTKKFGEIVFKNSSAEKEVFKRWSVKMKQEIVVIKKPLQPKGKHRHVTPEEWQEIITKEDVVILDARNTYEVAIGKFRNAIDPNIKQFHDFPNFVKNADIPKDKKVMMYCTGGIRCEKALLAMEAEGYDNVYQLEGGILAYLEKFPGKDFEGECFVFDHRAAVDQHLRPSTVFALCPHCGDPGDQEVSCFCGKQQKICKSCAADETQKTCLKRCRNELRKKVTV